ncbi:MAG: GTP cyclohydrolase I FolE [Pseudomonadota bacterium]
MSVEKVDFEENNAVSREEAEKAVETLLKYIGEDPTRHGLKETPARYVRAFDEFFEGYRKDPAKELQKTFEDIQDYDDFVLVRNIDFVSHCEHHIVPVIGKASVAYWPNKKVVGISKLARIVDIYARRLTSQEKMSKDIADVIDKTLDAKGCAVVIEANHQCMSTRGIHKSDSSTITSHFSGIFKDRDDIRERFITMVHS